MSTRSKKALSFFSSLTVALATIKKTMNMLEERGFKPVGGGFQKPGKFSPRSDEGWESSVSYQSANHTLDCSLAIVPDFVEDDEYPERDVEIFEPIIELRVAALGFMSHSFVTAVLNCGSGLWSLKIEQSTRGNETDIKWLEPFQRMDNDLRVGSVRPDAAGDTIIGAMTSLFVQSQS